MNNNINIQASIEDFSNILDETAQKCERCIHAQSINGDTSKRELVSCKPTKGFAPFDLTSFQIRNKCFLGYNIIKGYRQNTK